MTPSEYLVYKPHRGEDIPRNVPTHTLDAVSNPTIPTATLEASRHIDAGSMHVAVMSPDLTLINIWRNMEVS